MFLQVQVVTKPSRLLALDLVYRGDSPILGNPRRCGQLVVRAEECTSSRTTTELILRCSDLEHKDLFSRSVWPTVVLFLFLFYIFHEKHK